MSLSPYLNDTACPVSLSVSDIYMWEFAGHVGICPHIVSINECAQTVMLHDRLIN